MMISTLTDVQIPWDTHTDGLTITINPPPFISIHRDTPRAPWSTVERELLHISNINIQDFYLKK